MFCFTMENYLFKNAISIKSTVSAMNAMDLWHLIFSGEEIPYLMYLSLIHI